MSVLLLFTIFLAACQPAGGRLPTVASVAAIGAVPEPSETPRPTAVPPTMTATDQPIPSPTKTPPPTETAVPPTPTSSATPALTVTPSITPTATFWPTVTRQMLPAAQAEGLVPCTRREVGDDLLTIATQQFTLPQSYVPADLVPLADYFSDEVVRGLDLYVRGAIVDPLQQIVGAMQEAGLRPSILSAYRSYNEQAMAWKWWESQYPGRVAIMSARPGASEHQLGTTVDFGSPELNHLFHVDFAGTAEGVWLAENAPRFGFTMSYPADAYGVTGFKYEPWHFRYVGVELAQQLAASGQILTEWQLAHLPPPCIP